MSERVVSDEQLAGLERLHDQVGAKMLYTHSLNEPNWARCEAAERLVDAFPALVRALRDARGRLAAVNDWAMVNEITGPPLDWARLAAALAAPTGDRQDWTADANGRSNSSDTFVAIVAIVARLLRSEMWSITQDDAGRESAARLIVAQLAHKHGFAPVAAPTGQEQRG